MCWTTTIFMNSSFFYQFVGYIAHFVGLPKFRSYHFTFSFNGPFSQELEKDRLNGFTSFDDNDFLNTIDPLIKDIPEPKLEILASVAYINKELGIPFSDPNFPDILKRIKKDLDDGMSYYTSKLDSLRSQIATRQ